MSDKLQFVVGCVTVVIDKLKGVPIKLMRTRVLHNPRSGWKHKAWGGAERNPRMTKDKRAEAREACDSANAEIWSR
jgi:hypothetical protein